MEEWVIVCYLLIILPHISYRDEKYSIENVVNNVVIMLYGNYTYLGKHCIRYRIVELLCCITETNGALNVNYTSVIKI